MAGMGRATGATLTGAQKVLKLKLVTYWFFKLYFAPHTTINCKAASKQRPYLMHKLGMSRQHRQALWQNYNIVTQRDDRTL